MSRIYSTSAASISVTKPKYIGEPSWSNLCRRDVSKTGATHAALATMAVTFGWGFRPNKWPNPLSVASCWSWRWSAGIAYYKTSKSLDRLKVSAQSHETIWPPKKVVTDRLLSYGAAMKGIGNAGRKKLADSYTTGPKTHLDLLEDGNGRWLNSRVPKHSKILPQYTLLSTIISIWNTISVAAETSSTTDLPPLQNGGKLQPELYRYWVHFTFENRSDKALGSVQVSFFWQRPWDGCRRNRITMVF